MDTWSAVFFLLPLILSILLFLFSTSSKQAHLPPGPSPWPVIGNLPHLLVRLVSSNLRLHAALSSLSVDHGQLFYLRLGTWQLVVASSSAAAAEVLKSSDRHLRGRHLPATYRIPEFSDVSFIWNVDGDQDWKFIRTVVKTHLLSLPSLSKHAERRREKAVEMGRFLAGRAREEVQIGKIVFATLFNSLAETIFSREVLSLEDGKGSFPELKENMGRMLEIGVRPSLEDFFPSLTNGVDVHGYRGEVKDYLKKVYDIWDEILLNRVKGKGEEEDFVGVLQRSGVSYHQIRVVILEIFTAGTDTTTTLVDWVMSELLKNPDSMKRVKNELIQVMGLSSSSEEQGLAIPDEAQLGQLTFLHACVKEVLRLHPPVPLLLPHRAITSCEVMGYTIPEGCTVMVNVWAIGRDPKIWENPLEFSPERFLSKDLDYKGGNFEYIPFGAGMRMCPGMALASRFVSLMVATMVHNFEWILPGGKGLSELNMEEKLGIVLERKEPLVLIPKPVHWEKEAAKISFKET